MGWRIVVVHCLILCAQASAALAAEDPEALIHQGIELRRAGEDARAEGYFRRAYQLAATSRTAAQLGLVELAVGDYLNAEAHLSEALASRDAWILGNLKTLEESRAVVRQNLLRVEIVGAPPGTTLTFEGAQPQPLPPAGGFWACADKPETVRIEATNHKAVVVQVNGTGGQVQRLIIDMPLIESRDVQGSGRRLRTAGLAISAAGLVAGVAGALLYTRGTTKLHEYQAAIRSDGKIPWNPDDENWEGTRNAGVALFVAGGVAVAGGISLFLIGNSTERDEAERGKVSFVSGPGFGFLSYRGSF